MWSKLKQKKWIVRWMIPLMVLVMTFWTYSQYDQMEKVALNNTSSTWERDNLFDILNSVKYNIYQSLLRDGYGEDFSLLDWVEMTGTLAEWDYVNWPNNPSDVGYENLTEEEKQELTRLFVLDQIREDFGILEESRHHSFRNLQYFAIERESGTSILRGDPMLEELFEGTLDEELFNDLKAEYRHVIVYDFDESGEVSISFILDNQNRNEVLSFEELNTSIFGGSWEVSTSEVIEFSSYFNWLPIKNTSFVFAVPNVLTYDDDISWSRMSAISMQMQDILMVYVIFTTAIVALVTFLVPIRIVQEGKFITWLLRFPMEMMPFYFFVAILFTLQFIFSLIFEMPAAIIWSPFITRENAEVIFIHALNMGAWAFLFGNVGYLVLYIKNLFKQGFKGSLRNNSFIIGNLIKIHDFFFVDLREPATKTLFFFVLFQFIIINFIFFPMAANSFSPAWYFIGVMAIGIYSMLLFFILRRKLTTIREHYLRLFEVTSEMSNGNLDVQIEEDLGIFESIKEQLSQIKNGFKKAVENETTSQRMKTDLIANVSHDLKTPLTSIITYVDLLKDESLEKGKRQQYLATLEQKSHRLKVLIEDLFEMSKVSSGDIKLELNEIDVVALMKQTLMELEDKITEINLIIRPNFPDKKVKVMLDGGRTYRVFENLILNMVKYALPNTRAYIDIIEDEGQVIIMLRNISASEITINMNELTERFVRGDQSRHTDGSGLGLAIAKSIVELQDGTFNVQVDGDLFKVVMVFWR